MRLTRAFSAALAAALFVAGCSGGGGGGGGGNGGDPPIADAGDDGAARLYQSYSLDGSQSLDPEGKDLSFAWSVISAPDGAALTLTSGGTTSNVAFTPDREGIYLFGLVVSDGKKLSTLDTVEVTVEMRVAVFADRDGGLARELELQGAGDVDDYYGWPDSYLETSYGDILLFHDTRTRLESLIAYRVSDGTQELIARGEDIGEVRFAGDHVVWRESRDGDFNLFTRDLLTGAEHQITFEDGQEYAGGISPEYFGFSKPNDLYGYDAYYYDFASHGSTNVTGVDLGVDDFAPAIDADTVLIASYASTPDVWGFDIGTQLPFPIATATTATEFAYGLLGDLAIVSISTGGGYTLYTIDVDDGTRRPVSSSINYLVDTGDDWFLYRDGNGLSAHQTSTGATVVVEPNGQNDASLSGNVAVWSVYNPGTDSYDVKTRTLPGGAVTTIPNTGDAENVAALDSGIAWDSHQGSWVFDVYYTPDGGTTVEHASSGKVLLTDRVADYDVAIFGGDGGTSFGDETIEALSAAGVPILSLDREGDSVLDYYMRETLFGLDEVSEDCGVVAVRFNDSQHPAFAGFPSGSYAVLDREDVGDSYQAQGILIDDLSPPTDYFPIATYDAETGCPYEGEAAIALLTDANGTAIIIDAAGRDELSFWTTARRELILSELRYLASTRAP